MTQGLTTGGGVSSDGVLSAFHYWDKTPVTLDLKRGKIDFALGPVVR